MRRIERRRTGSGPPGEAIWIEGCLAAREREEKREEAAHDSELAFWACMLSYCPHPIIRMIHRSTTVNNECIRAVGSLLRGEYLVELHDGTRLTSGRSYGRMLHAVIGKERCTVTLVTLTTSFVPMNLRLGPMSLIRSRRRYMLQVGA